MSKHNRTQQNLHHVYVSWYEFYATDYALKEWRFHPTVSKAVPFLTLDLAIFRLTDKL